MNHSLLLGLSLPSVGMGRGVPLQGQGSLSQGTALPFTHVPGFLSKGIPAQGRVWLFGICWRFHQLPSVTMDFNAS